MSKTIDQRVVEMQFDNKNFEKNVAESMSTLEKLKSKLNFSGASHAMDELNSSVKNLNMSPLEKAVEGVHTKFSALEVVAVTALANIANEAVNTGKQLIASLTTDNIEAGWEKFGQKTTSVATLVSQGYELEEVNAQLEKLNWFTDETSYNFTDMVGEIGKFTASGQALDDSVTAMMGIANWAALSGQNASTASRAMYQLSQAMGKGALKYDDWKSIQNASMDTKEFREQATQAAISLGMMKKTGEDAYQFVYEAADGSAQLSEVVYSLNDLFTSDLLTKKAWFDSDVMMKVFSDYGKATNTLKAIVDDTANGIDTASEAMDDLEKKAEDYVAEMNAAGQNITFNEALQKVSLDVVKSLDDVRAEAEEYIQSIYETEGRTLDLDSALVELGYGLDEFSLKALRSAQEAKTWADVIDSVKDAVSTGWMNTFETIFGNYEEAKSLWTRLANDFYDIFASGAEQRNEMLGIWKEIGGRDLLFSTDENNLGALLTIVQSIKDVLSAINDAKNEIFYGTSDAEEVMHKNAETLMNLTKAIKSFTDRLRTGDETLDKIKRSFKGLFAIVDIITSFFKTAFTTVWTNISSLFGEANGSILDVTASVGDSLTTFRDWIKENKVFETAFENIANAIKFVIGAIKDFAANIRSLPFVSTVIDNVRASFTRLGSYINEFFKRIQNGENASDVISDIVSRFETLNNIKKFLSDTWDSITKFWNDFTNLQPKESVVNNAIISAIEAIKNAFTQFLDFLGATNIDLDSAFEAIKQTLSSLTIEDIAMIAVGAALVIFIIKLFNAVKKIGGIVDAFDRLSESISGLFDTVKSTIKANSVAFIAGSILALVAALTVIAYLDPDRVWNAVAVLSVITGIFIALIYVVNSLKNLGTAAIAIAGLAAGLALLSGALSIIAKMNTGILSESATVLGLLGTWMLVVGALITRLVSEKATIKNMAGVAIMFVGMAAALYIMAGAIDKLTKLDLSNIDKVSELMLKMMTGMAIVTAASKLMGKGSAASIIASAVSLYLVIGAIKLLAKMDYGEIALGLQGVQKIFSIFADTLMVVGLSSFGRGAKGVGPAILSMTVSLWLIIGLIGVIGNIPVSQLEQGTKVLSSVMWMMALIIAASKLAGEHASEAGSMLFKMAGAIAVLSLVIGLLAFISQTDEQAFNNAVNAVSILSAIFGGIVVMSKNASESKGALTAIMIAIIALAACVAALTIIDPTGEAVMTAAMAISMVLAVFAGVIASTKLTKGASKALIPMIVGIGLIGGVLVALTALPIQNSLENAIALSIVMLALSGSLVLVTRFASPESTGSLIPALLIMAGAMVAIGAILVELAKYDTGSAITNAIAIGILMATMMGSLIIVNAFGTFAGQGLASLAVITAVVAVIGIILSAMGGLEPGSAIEHAGAIAIVLLSMSATLLMLIPVGVLAAQAIAGAAILLGFIAIFGAVIAGIGALMQNEDIANAVNTGLPMLEELGKGLGSFFGGIIEGWATAVSNSLPAIGLNIEKFGESLGKFFESIKDVKAENVQGLESLAGVIMMLSAAEFIQAASSFANLFIGAITGQGTQVNTFSQNLKAFGEAVNEFYNSVSGIEDPEKLQKAADAAYSLVNVANSIPKHGGLVQKFTGDSNLGEFVKDIDDLAIALIDFSHLLIMNGGIDEDAVEAAIRAASMISGFADNLPKHGGFWQALIGDNTLFDFGRDMLAFAPYLVETSKIFKEGNIDTDSINTAVNAATMLRGLTENLPAHGGLWQKLAGESSLLDFGRDLALFAPYLVMTADTFKESSIDINSVNTAVTAAQMLSGFANGLPKEGGFLDFFTGHTDVSGFADDINSLGIGLKMFAVNVEGIDPDATGIALNALEVLSTLENNLPETGNIFTWLSGEGKDLDGFINDMPKLAEGIKTFSDALMKDGGIQTEAVSAAANTLSAMSELSKVGSLGNAASITEQLIPIANNLKSYSDILKDTPGFADGIMDDIAVSIRTLSGLEKELAYTDYKKIEMAFGKLDSLVGLLNRVSKLDTEKITAFGDVMNSFGKDGLTQFLNAFKNESSSLEDGAMIMLNSFIRGVSNNENLFTDAFIKIADAGISAVRGKYSEYVDAGSYIAQSMIGGMESSAGNETSGFSSAITNVISQVTGSVSGGAGSQFSFDGIADSFMSNITGAFDGNEQMSTIGSDMFDQIGGALTSGSGVNFSFDSISADVMTGLSDSIKENIPMMSDVGGVSLDSMLGSFVDEGAKTNITSTASDVEKMFTDSIKGKNVEFEGVGEFAVDGFVNGINNSLPDIKQAGYDIADQFKTEIENQLQIASPSKVMYDIGGYVGEGFVNGISSYASISGNKGKELGDAVVDGLSSAVDTTTTDDLMNQLNRLAAVLENIDVSPDIQPTITPVLDLSNVNAGMGTIDGMFNASRSIQLAEDTNLRMGSLSTDIQNRIDVNNDDVVGAIRGLRSDVVALNESMSKKQVVLDTKKLVGGIVEPMNTALGTKARNTRRG